MQLSIATKIFIAFTAVILMFAAVLMFGIYRTQTTYDQIQSINRSIVPLSLTLSDVQTDLKSYSLILNEKDPLVLRRTLQVTRLAPSVPDRFRHKMDRAASMAELAQFAEVAGEGNPALARTKERVGLLQEDIQRFAERSQIFTQSVLAEEAPGSEEILTLQNALRADARELDSRLTTLRNDLRSATDVGLARAKDLERSSLYAVSAGAASALLIAVLLLIGVLITMRRLTLLTEAAKRIGEGDYGPLEELPERPAQDEIGTLTREFDSMARSIADRDQALRDQHAKLLKSERLATVGRMTSLITHELRNPLSSINLNTEMLMESLMEDGATERDPELATTLETIIGEVDRLRDITEEYLVFARLPSPKLERTDLADVVQGLVDFHLFEWAQTDVTVDLEILDAPLYARLDPSQMRQAMLNLVKNAVEASSTGSIVEVRMSRRDDEIITIVEDHAGGIPDDVFDHVFEPFFTTKRSGTGLGLAMTQQIIEEHEGSIEIERTDDGTRFIVRLPAEK